MSDKLFRSVLATFFFLLGFSSVLPVHFFTFVLSSLSFGNFR